MSVSHLRCCGDGAYGFEVGGILGESGVARVPRRVAVSSDGSWRLTEGAAQPGEPRFLDTILVPALVDAHVHLHPDVEPSEYVRFGVCRIRDLGSCAEDAPVAGGCDRPLPEVLRGGPMLDRPGRRRLLIAAEWHDADELPAILDSARASGADWVKLYEGFPARLFGRVVELAGERGLRVAVHPAPGEYRAALSAGVEEIEHLACLIPQGERGTHAALSRWARWSPSAGWPDLPAGTRICPTLLAPSALVEHARAGWAFEGHDPTMAEFWRSAAIARRPWSPAELQRGELAIRAMRLAVAELDSAGIHWVVGSDTPNPGLRPGQSLWQEMNELIAAGLDGRRVFRSAAIEPSVAATGTHPLMLLPADTPETGPFSPAPPSAVMLRGCLYTPNGATP